ncbi:MAG: hypothetical protein ACREJ9_13975 [Candidatus Rokuibacteriota bacterium]
MKRTCVAVLVAVALVIPAIAFAEEPVAAWCGGSYGAAGTNFGECVKVEAKARVAGATGGMREQTVSVPTFPEYPATMVTFERGRVIYDTGNVDKDGRAIKKELNLKFIAAPERFGEVEAPGTD